MDFMREGWEYKKLGEVTLYPTNRVAIQNLSPNLYVGVENLVKDRGGVSFSEQLPNAKSAIEYINDDILIGNIRPYLKKIWLSNQKGGASGDVIVVRIKDEFVDLLSSAFLCKVLSSDNFFDYDNQNTKGAKMPRGDKKAIAQYLIPLPPKSVQLEIVSELDQINELIRLKKEQLKDYDKLAQSIFYEMFGDPVENGKGWEVKRFSEVFNVTSSKRIYLQELVNEGVPFLKVSDIVSMVDGKEAVPKSFIKESLFDDLQSRGLVPRKGDLLITARGTLGKCYIMKETDRFYFQDGMVTWLQKKVELESLFVKYVFCDNSFRVYLNRNAKHTTVDYISIQHLGNMKIPLPPLPLQQEFSSLISQIERQKAEVSNAIADLETLLASRMQYWFE